MTQEELNNLIEGLEITELRINVLLDENREKWEAFFDEDKVEDLEEAISCLQSAKNLLKEVKI